MESDRHDFKLDLPDVQTLTRTCCAFANSFGGYVIVGVGQRNGFHVVGLSADAELAKRFGDKVTGEPTVFFSIPLAIPVPSSNRFVYVVEVPASAMKPHVPAGKDNILVWKRTNRGNERMTLEEIRGLFIRREERLARLHYLLVELAESRDQVMHLGRFEGDPNTGTFAVGKIELGALEQLLGFLYSELSSVPGLMDSLIEYRRRVRYLNSQAEHSLARMAHPNASEATLAFEYSRLAGNESNYLVPLLDKATSLITAHLLAA
jgi:hypothetical protein